MALVNRHGWRDDPVAHVIGGMAAPPTQLMAIVFRADDNFERIALGLNIRPRRRHVGCLDTDEIQTQLPDGLHHGDLFVLAIVSGRCLQLGSGDRVLPFGNRPCTKARRGRGIFPDRRARSIVFSDRDRRASKVCRSRSLWATLCAAQRRTESNGQRCSYSHGARHPANASPPLALLTHWTRVSPFVLEPHAR